MTVDCRQPSQAAESGSVTPKKLATLCATETSGWKTTTECTQNSFPNFTLHKVGLNGVLAAPSSAHRASETVNKSVDLWRHWSARALAAKFDRRIFFLSPWTERKHTSERERPTRGNITTITSQHSAYQQQRQSERKEK